MTTSGGSTRKPAGSRDLYNASAVSSLFPGELVKTSAIDPVFLIYLPQHTAPRAEWGLSSDATFTTPVYEQQLDLPTGSGLLRLALPSDPGLPVLTRDPIYSWRFTLVYKIKGRGTPEAITERIQLVAIAPEIQSQLNQATPQERVNIYRSHDSFYDACVELDQMRRHDPTDAWAQETWSAWMRDRGQEHLVAVPTIDCP